MPGMVCSNSCAQAYGPMAAIRQASGASAVASLRQNAS